MVYICYINTCKNFLECYRSICVKQLESIRDEHFCIFLLIISASLLGLFEFLLKIKTFSYRLGRISARASDDCLLQPKLISIFSMSNKSFQVLFVTWMLQIPKVKRPELPQTEKTKNKLSLRPLPIIHLPRRRGAIYFIHGH